jgi:hypothetical protein
VPFGVVGEVVCLGEADVGCDGHADHQVSGVLVHD